VPQRALCLLFAELPKEHTQRKIYRAKTKHFF
jgi:hypothetical protein